MSAPLFIPAAFPPPSRRLPAAFHSFSAAACSLPLSVLVPSPLPRRFPCLVRREYSFAVLVKRSVLRQSKAELTLRTPKSLRLKRTERQNRFFSTRITTAPRSSAFADTQLHIPLLHVVGDADKVVPVSENTAIVEKRYKALGGQIQVIHKKGVGHHPHSLKDPKPIVDFILKHAQKENSSDKK